MEKLNVHRPPSPQRKQDGGHGVEASLLLHHQNGKHGGHVANEQQEVIKLFTVATTIANTIINCRVYEV